MVHATRTALRKWRNDSRPVAPDLASTVEALLHAANRIALVLRCVGSAKLYSRLHHHSGGECEDCGADRVVSKVSGPPLPEKQSRVVHDPRHAKRAEEAEREAGSDWANVAYHLGAVSRNVVDTPGLK